jgi:ATP-dependent protease ClpP protease subunit
MSKESKIPFRITAAKQGGKAAVRITGEIGWDTDSNVFRTECDQLLDAGVKDVHVYMNTPGGSVFDANEIVNILAGFTGKKTGEGGALVASAGTYIAMHLDSFTMPANGRFMIHKPSGITMGNAGKIKNYVNLLEGLERDYFDAYIAKATDPTNFKAKWESGNDYWMTAKEAREAGFITAVREKVAIDKESAMMIAACMKEFRIPSFEFQVNQSNKDEMDFKQTVLAALGLAENASDSEVIKALIKLSENNRELTEVNATLTKERNQLQTDFDLLKSANDQAEKNGLLTAAEKDKRITAREKDAYLKLDIADVKALLEDRKAPVNPMTFIGTPDVNTPSGSDKWVFADWTKNDPDGLGKMKANDPERYKALFKAQYGKESKIN